MDNLESGTYEVFEKDPVKYREYEEVWSYVITYWHTEHCFRPFSSH